MFGGEAVLLIVFVGQRPMAVVDAEQVALAVVGIFNNAGVGQGFSYEASGVIALVTGNELTAIVTVFDFFLQVAIEVVDVGRTLPVKPGFLLDQPIGVVSKSVGLANLVFDLGQQ